MNILVDWSNENQPDIFIAKVEHNGIEYNVCVEQDGRWIYTIDNELMDMPVCSFGSYNLKEQAQRAALKRIEKEG